MKHKYKIISTLLISFVVLQITAQSNGSIVEPPMVIPNSPQVAAFARYGEYPVSKSTGVPQIDIPLYQIQIGDISIPISISYHASGIKVEDVAPPVGLGWSLNTGGCIARTVYSGVDNFGYYQNYRVKSVKHLGELKLQSQYRADIDNTWRKWMNNMMENSESDRYIYSFNGINGVFRYNSLTNEITTIPYAPLKIEVVNNRMFKITNTDGLIYFFEQEEQSSLHNIMYPSAWHLTKIESQQTGSVINYKYKAGSYYIQYNKSESISKGKLYYDDCAVTLDLENKKCPDIREQHYAMERIPRKGIQSFNPQLVDEITWGNNRIKFNYAVDRKDKYKDRLINIEIYVDKEIVKTVFFDNNSYWGDTELNYRMRLNSLEVKGENNTSVREKYQFKYNTQNLPQYGIYYREDYWGYSNGAKLDGSIPKEYALAFAADRNPNESFMKHCILEEIIYPTGGSTTFEFEANRASLAYDYSTNTIVGGLRVKNIISRSEDKEIRKSYEYSLDPANQMIQKDMFYYKQDRINTFEDPAPLRGFIRKWTEWEVTVSNPLYSITGWSSCPVFYTEVTEYIGTPTQNIGKIVSHHKPSLREVSAFPDYPNDKYDQNLNRFWSPYYNYDQGLLEPLLISECTYEFSNNLYKPKKMVNNTYKPVDMGQIICGVRMSLRNHWIHSGGNKGKHIYEPYNSFDQFFNEDMEYYDVIGYRYFNLLSSTKTIDYTDNGEVETKIDYTYDPQYRLLSPISQKTTNSNGSVVTETTKHPFNETVVPYPDMVKNNVIGLVTKQEKTIGVGKSIAIQNIHRQEGTKYLLDQVKSGMNGVLEPRIKYHNYDKYGNPLYITKDDAYQIVYLWSYNYQHPIAEIKNSTYAEVVTALQKQSKTVDGLSAMITPSWDTVKFRADLPNALISTYTYKPLVGMLTATDPSGKRTTYEYDSFNRLYRIKDHEGKVVEEFKYNYSNK